MRLPGKLPNGDNEEAFWNEIKYKGIKWKLSKLRGQNENITKLKGSKVDFSLIVISIKKKNVSGTNSLAL